MGKKVILLEEIKNGRGECIHKGETATIERKYRGFEIVTAEGITISRVQPYAVMLFDE